jgi:hypothetical protein
MRVLDQVHQVADSCEPVQGRSAVSDLLIKEKQALLKEFKCCNGISRPKMGSGLTIDVTEFSFRFNGLR